jgi:hypothetical protein
VSRGGGSAAVEGAGIKLPNDVGLTNHCAGARPAQGVRPPQRLMVASRGRRSTTDIGGRASPATADAGARPA